MSKTGAWFSPSGVLFRIWAPGKDGMELHLGEPATIHKMKQEEDGYHELLLENVKAGTSYQFAAAGEKPLPDPASHYQPGGVHAASAVVDHQAFQWSDQEWRGLPFNELVMYELHVGTFTPEGTFDAIIPRLPEFAQLGINALELMPISEFPGNRNWGYDGVYPFSVHSSYGGPDAFKRLVDEAHKHGIAVFLDVVFNHLGPEGNYFDAFGPYFTDTYCTPWGKAINMDGEWSDGVRAYFSDAVLHWYETYHLDGLRVDAIHTIFDNGAVHFWELVDRKLAQARQATGRSFHLIAESDLNSPRVVKSPEVGGYGFTAQWLDDFHHALYVLLDKEGATRYEDFGKIEQLTKAYKEGFVHSGDYVKFRRRKHGASSAGLCGDTFVVFNQNHDQVGNRVGGERLSVLVDFERQKIASAAMLLSPYIPLFFMGEEYGEDTPFFYFVSHSDEELIGKVVEGRQKEFEKFDWGTEPLNPQEESTFEQSKIRWDKRTAGKYRVMLEWNKLLIRLRRENAALRNFDKNYVDVNVLSDEAFVLLRRSEDDRTQVACVFNLGEEAVTWKFPHARPQWRLLVNSGDEEWAENAAQVQDSENGTQLIAYQVTLQSPGVKVLEWVHDGAAQA